MSTENLEESLRFLQQSRTFLGREFLTWLWFQSETLGHGVGEGWKLFVDDRMVLSTSGSAVQSHSLKGGAPAYATEARVALREGKLAQEMKILLQKDDRSWSFTLTADDLSPRSLKIPEAEASDFVGLVEMRLELMEAPVRLIESLYSQYLELRQGPHFEAVRKSLHDWMQREPQFENTRAGAQVQG